MAVEVVGEPADYRDVGDSLTIGVSTADIAGERDWFDLGVTIVRRRPRAAVRRGVQRRSRAASRTCCSPTALTSRCSQPGLQELRRLIEEARALADSPSAPLRISRYQAGLWAELAALGVVTEQAQAWQRQVGALLETRRDRRARAAGDACRRSCAPTSARGSAGWRRCGSSSSAGSSPTTWGSARRCRRSR